MNERKNFELIAKTLYGLEEVLANELKQLGADQVKKGNRAVYFMADKELLYKTNYCLRTAISILKPLFNFTANNDNELYQKVFEIDWSDIFNMKQTFAIEATVYSTLFKHSQYAALKVKDAIVDRFRSKTNTRPTVDTKNPDILINLHISENNCSLSLNSSGEPLFKRGYRVAALQAPLNEVLAAGLIALSGWQPGQHFIDPMCGSGTLLIEAALIAKKISPGTFRKKFSFENWPDFDHEIFGKVKNDSAIEKIISTENRFIGADLSAKAISIAGNNIKNAFLHQGIELITSDFKNFLPPVASGVIITNPPYGERMQAGDLIEFYKSFGNILKLNFKNFDAWILSSNIEAMKHIGLHPSKKIKLMNASLECTFNKYTLYEGSKKNRNNKE